MTSHPGPGSRPVEALAVEQEAFARLVEDADLAAPVPACTPWTVLDLARHLTAVHRWAAHTVRQDAAHGVPDDGPFERAAGRGGTTAAAVADGHRAAAAELRAALADGGRPCPTLVGPGVVGWWARRQLHETFVHRLDLAGALGRPMTADPTVAADCVAEVVDTMMPRQVALGRIPAPTAGVLLTAPTAAWVLGGPPVAAVTGPALALAQLVWRRTGLDDVRLTVTGDRAAAALLLADRITP